MQCDGMMQSSGPVMSSLLSSSLPLSSDFDTTEMNGDTCTAYIPENKQCGHDCCPSTVPLCQQ